MSSTPRAMRPAPTTDAGENVLRGIGFMLVSVACMSTMDVLAKWVVASVAVPQMIALRSIIVLALAAAMVARAGGLSALATRRPRGHALRIVLSVGAMLTFFEGLRQLPLATAISLGFSAPLFMTALSVPFLGEKVGAHRWAAVFVGFIGVLIVIQPGGEGTLSWPALLVVASAMFFAGVMLTVRSLAPTESDAAMIVYQNLGVLIVTGLIAPFVWTWPNGGELVAIAVMGVVLVASQLAMQRSFRAAPVGAVAPFQYTELLWASLFGYAIWGETPGWNVWGGASVIVASGLYVIWRETYSGMPGGPRS